MGVIYKYSIMIADQQHIAMPRRPTFLDLQMQGDKLCIWAMFADADIASGKERVHTIAVHGTGNPMPDDPGDYLGTIQVGLGVWHVFDETPDRAIPMPAPPAEDQDRIA